VIVGVPHHVVQRGSRRQRTFFSDDDYDYYTRVLREQCRRHNVTIWAYCLMPNHVHLIAVPQKPESLALCLGETHRRYAVRINEREGWTGHLWQQRFSSYPMDDHHLVAAVRYIERNPVAAGLVGRPETWRWSSARAHLVGKDDRLVTVEPLLARVPDWKKFLKHRAKVLPQYAEHERSGLPLGNEDFVDRCEIVAGRSLRPGKPGPKGPRLRAVSLDVRS
jgi:putative transposase